MILKFPAKIAPHLRDDRRRYVVLCVACHDPVADHDELGCAPACPCRIPLRMLEAQADLIYEA